MPRCGNFFGKKQQHFLGDFDKRPLTPMGSDHHIISGPPLSPVDNGRIYLVDGSLGNTVMVSAQDIAEGREFYMLFAAEEGRAPEEVASAVRDQYKLQITEKNGTATRETDSFEIAVDPLKSLHYRDPKARAHLNFRPDLRHLNFEYGDKADYFLVACRFNPEEAREIFPPDKRLGVFSDGHLSGNFNNTLRYELIFKSAHRLLDDNPAADSVDTMIRGGLAVYDRHAPNGAASDVLVYEFADNHVDKSVDALALAILDRSRKNPDDIEQYLRLTNPNDLTEIEFRHVNAEHAKGLADMVFMLGDNINQDSPFYTETTRLAETNQDLFGRYLATLKVPVKAVKGNHEELMTAAPPIISSNFTLSGSYVLELQKERYGDNDLAGYLKIVADGQRALLEHPHSLRSFYSTVNPYNDMLLRLQGSDDSGLKPVSFGFYDTGPEDLAHWRPDDADIYLEKEQLFWTYAFPYQHLLTIYQFVTQQSPDLRGLTNDQIAWAAQQSVNYILTHGPVLNNLRQEPYAPDLTAPIRPLENAGPYGDNNFGAMAHNGESVIRSCLEDSDCRGNIAAHQHTLGNQYVVGTGPNNETLFFKGNPLEVLSRIFPGDAVSVSCFWNTTPECLASPNVSADLKTLHQGTENIRNKKFFWQIGSAGTGAHPVFQRKRFNAEGMISEIKFYYPRKVLRQDPNNPLVYRIAYEIGETPAPGNEALVEQWRALTKENPRRRLDLMAEVRRLQARIKPDHSYVPNIDLLQPYAAIHNPIIPEEIYKDPEFVTASLKPRLFGNQALRFKDGEFGFDLTDYGAALQVNFNNDILGPIVRTYLMGGVELGWKHRDGIGDSTYLAWVASTFPLGWKPLPNAGLILRGVDLSLGIGIQVDAEKNLSATFHNSIDLLEMVWRAKQSGMEYSLGLRYDNVFSGPGQLLLSLSIAVPFSAPSE